MQDADTGPIGQLKDGMRDITSIKGAINVLTWDQLTKMPPRGVAARAEQLAVLRRYEHARLTDPEIGALLARAEDAAAALDPDSDEAALVRIVRRDHDRAVKVPEELVFEIARTAALADRVWIDAREHNDFASFAPWLRKIVELDRRRTACLGYQEHPFDALVDEAEPGMTTASVRALFDQLRPQLLDLARTIAPRSGAVDDSVLFRDYDVTAQETLGRAVATQFGYDFNRGRLDRTVHPFEMAIARDDVRITTRYDPCFLSMSLMGTMHETGHALYEQGVSASLSGTPLCHGVSAGVHESQSRLWENYVGRSRPFWRYFFPRVRSAFPGVLDDQDPERFYRAVNKVKPSLIRVEADEVTYCLHIMWRFEMEIALLDGNLKVEDAPAAWNDAVQRYLGITPPNDTQGILQDIHWSGGLGGFQGYALGNIIAAQLWETLLTAHPDLPAQIEQGEFSTLLGWLGSTIYYHGRKFDPADLVTRVTGKPLQVEPYLRYLRAKFTDIYGV